MHRLKLKSLHRFTSTATALEEISAIQEGKLGKGLKQFLSEQIVDKGKGKERKRTLEEIIDIINDKNAYFNKS